MMSTTEALRLQLDALRTENQELEAENAKLKRQRSSSESEDSTEITEELRKENEQLQQDVSKLKQLYEEVLGARQSQQTGEAREVAEISTLEERLKEEIEERILHVKRAENLVSLARPIPLQARGRVWGNACIEFVSRRRKSCVPISSLSFDYAR